MRIPQTVTAFRRWARKPRVKTTSLMSVGACVAFNEAKADRVNGIASVLEIVAEESAIRWELASARGAKSK